MRLGLGRDSLICPLGGGVTLVTPAMFFGPTRVSEPLIEAPVPRSSGEYQSAVLPGAKCAHRVRQVRLRVVGPQAAVREQLYIASRGEPVAESWHPRELPDRALNAVPEMAPPSWKAWENCFRSVERFCCDFDPLLGIGLSRREPD